LPSFSLPFHPLPRFSSFVLHHEKAFNGTVTVTKPWYRRGHGFKTELSARRGHRFQTDLSALRNDSPALQPAQVVVLQAGVGEIGQLHGVVPDVFPQLVRVVVGFPQDVQNFPEQGVTGRAGDDWAVAVAWPSHEVPPQLIGLKWDGEDGSPPYLGNRNRRAQLDMNF
jgi:hypothetical protein